MTLPVRREFDDLYQLMRSALGGSTAAWLPSADVSETDDAYVIEVDLPGAKPEDVNIELTGNDLVISGEIKETARKGLFRRRTRRVGRFEFRATLPGELDPDGIEAGLDGGVLTVRVPKAERAKPRKIKISHR
jgi:HSP20 family protein